MHAFCSSGEVSRKVVEWLIKQIPEVIVKAVMSLYERAAIKVKIYITTTIL